MRAISLEHSNYLNHFGFGLNMLHMQLCSLNKSVHGILLSTNLPGVTEDADTQKLSGTVGLWALSLLYLESLILHTWEIDGTARGKQPKYTGMLGPV